MACRAALSRGSAEAWNQPGALLLVLKLVRMARTRRISRSRSTEKTSSTRWRAYDNHFVSVITIRDRKVTRWRDYLDPVAVFDALGWPAQHK